MRLQIYGNSFLNFAVSLMLFDTYKSASITELTKRKIQITGRQNLFSSGLNIGIDSYIRVPISLTN